MATRVDHLADSDSPLASRARELTARFIDDALPYLNQLNDRARRMTRMLRAYAGFNTFSDGTNLRAWVFRVTANTYINGLRRTQHRASGYLTDRQRRPGPTLFARATIGRTRCTDALPEIQLADALVILPMQFRLAVYYRDIAGLRCREVAESMACCEGTVSSRLHRRRQRLRTLLRTTRGRA